ncbi:MAG: 50S ribosomal protein L27 [Patescibacteria group bacterium]
MAHRKAQGSTKNDRDSNPKYRGIKVGNGEQVHTGMVLVRQKGTVVLPGKNVGMGRDYTLFALKNGTVAFKEKRKISFDSSMSRKKVVDVA